MQCYILLCEFVLKGTAKDVWTCFNLQVKCTSTNNRCVSPRFYEYNHVAVPTSVNVNINCGSNEMIQITRIDYFLPAFDTNAKPYYCPDKGSCAGVSYGDCVCCTTSGTVDHMCNVPASTELASECKDTHGSCSFSVPRYTFNSSTCPLTVKTSNCRAGEDICHSRWVRVHYECMTISTTSTAADEISDTGLPILFSSSLSCISNLYHHLE